MEEEEVDVNRRDRWDSVPLYYACLAGMRAHYQADMTCCEQCERCFGFSSTPFWAEQ